MNRREFLAQVSCAFAVAGIGCRLPSNLDGDPKEMSLPPGVYSIEFSAKGNVVHVRDADGNFLGNMKVSFAGQQGDFWTQIVLARTSVITSTGGIFDVG